VTGLVVGASPVESDRFGLRVGRLLVGPGLDVAELESACDGYDVVVLRCRADDVELPFRLLGLRDFLSFTADHLSVWRWEAGDFMAIDPPRAWSVRLSVDAAEVESVVRDSFAGYRNHYTADLLFDPRAALDGYVEWASTVMAHSDDGCSVLYDATGEAIGVALVEWSENAPDVALAGIRGHAQGRGLYGVLISHVMQQTLDRSRPALTISTQSHNVNVMRVWSRLGFRPVDALATVHVVRRELVAARLSRDDATCA
jgi:hypothetical protein